MSHQRRTRPGEADMPIFTSVGDRRLRRAGTAIIVLTVAALVAVLWIVLANTVG